MWWRKTRDWIHLSISVPLIFAAENILKLHARVSIFFFMYERINQRPGTAGPFLACKCTVFTMDQLLWTALVMYIKYFFFPYHCVIVLLARFLRVNTKSVYEIETKLE